MLPYTCTTSLALLQKYLESSSQVAFTFITADTLGLGKDRIPVPLLPGRRVIGCSFSNKEGTGLYVPLDHQEGNNFEISEFIAFLARFLSDPTFTKITHNLAFASAIAYSQGIVIQPPVYDICCASQMCLKAPNQFRTLAESGLSDLVSTLGDESITSLMASPAGTTLGNYSDSTSPAQCAAAEADLILRLYLRFNEWFDHNLPRHRTIVEEIESPVAVGIGILKFNGVPIDQVRLQAFRDQAEAKLAQLRCEILFLIGDVDLGANGSSPDFRRFLFEDLGLPILTSTKSGHASLDDDAVQRLITWCKEHRPALVPVLERIKELRMWSRIESTYLDGYMRHIDPDTKCIHPDILQLSTKTGRMSCRNPNLQNIPRRANDPTGIRSCIKAPDGHLILSADYSQVELRASAFLSRDKRMCNIYREGGDIHAATASVIFGTSYAEETNSLAPDHKEHRAVAKTVNFSAIYGTSAQGLQKTLAQAGIQKSLYECESILRNLTRGFEGLSEWQQQVKAEASLHRYSETWLGRRRYLPDIASADWKLRSAAERQAVNTPVQGTAADIIKIAMTRILRSLPQRTWLKPILQIHDELVFVIPAARLNEAAAFVRHCMEQPPFPEFDIPLPVGISVGPTFGDLQQLSYEHEFEAKKL